MIDIHSHIIHEVDDGPSTILQSLKMVQAAERLGISTIVASPHYHAAVFELERLEENYQELLYKARDYAVAIQLGYEVFINPDQHIMPDTGKTGITLLEFPYNADPRRCVAVVSEMEAGNTVPVIAHLERNRIFLDKPEYAVGFIKAGCHIQVDAASIAGVYGSRIKLFAKRLLELKLADTVASNAHCPEDYEKWYFRACRKVEKWVGKNEADHLFRKNPLEIINGIQTEEYLGKVPEIVWGRLI